MGYIRDYKGKHRAEVDKNGVRKSAVFDSKILAKEWVKRTELAISDKNAEQGFTFGDACDKYLAEVSSTKDGEKWEIMRIRAFRSHFRDETLLSAIDAPQIGDWRDKRLKTVTSGTVLRECNLLRNIFNIARKEWHWMEHYPFESVKMPKENDEREAVWPWQLIRIVLRAPATGKTQEVIDAFHIALRTGLRLQEVLAAPRLFDKTKQIVRLPAEFDKMGRRRDVPIGRIAAKLLLRPVFKVEANEASTLFADLTGALGIDDYTNKLGMETLTFHDSRATALTHLARKVDVMRLAKISGHRDIRILQNRYFRERAENISKLI